MTQLMNQKGVAPNPLGNLSGAAMQFVVIAMIISFGALILTVTQSAVENQSSNTSIAYTTVGQGLSALSQFGSWFVILAIVIVAGTVIFLLVRSFGAGSA